MRLYGRPVRYNLRDSAVGGEAGSQWHHWAYQPAVTEVSPEADDFPTNRNFDQFFPDQEPGDDDSSAYQDSVEWSSGSDSDQWAGHSQERTEHSWAEQDRAGLPDFRQQVLVSRPAVSYPLIPYWSTERMDQTLIWLTFLTIFLVVFFLALLLGWVLQRTAKAFRRRSENAQLKRDIEQYFCHSPQRRAALLVRSLSASHAITGSESQHSVAQCICYQDKLAPCV